VATPLAKRAAGAAASAPAARSPAAVVLERGPRGELLDVPGLGPVWFRLLGIAFWEDLELGVARMLKGEGLGLAEITAETIELYKTRRIVAAAARDPADHDQPFGTLEEWGDLDGDLVHAAMAAFGDLRERLTPLDVVLTEDQRTFILAAVKKKDRALLRSFAHGTLVSWLLTTELPLETSPTTRSNDGDVSPAS
jgi:hypothetical protein